MTRLHLAPGIDLPIDWITQRTAVYGVSRAGKSTLGRLTAELIHKVGQRFGVLDLKGDWWGLKSSADGKSAGIPVVIFGGKHADVPLDPAGGAQLADVVVSLPHSFILDLGSLSKTKQIRFVGAFLERLYEINEEPFLLICDEADIYAPQRTISPEQNVTLGAADDIARRAGGRGIGSLWICQRTAIINKNITSMCELHVTFRTPGKRDKKELLDNIGSVASEQQSEEVKRTVGGLANGQAIFLSESPATRMFATVQLPMPWTFDSSATPKVGERRIVPKVLAAPDLEALGERIKVAIEQAKADDPKHLKKRIADLETEVRRAKTATPAAADPEELRRLRAELAAANNTASTWARHAGNVNGLRLRAVEQLQLVVTGLETLDPAPPAPAQVTRITYAAKELPARVPVRPAQPRAGFPEPSDEGDVLSNLQRALLVPLAQRPEGLTKAQILIHAGYKSSGDVSKAFAALSRAQLIDVEQGQVRITAAGVDRLGDFEPLPTGAALRDRVLAQSSKLERALLEVLFVAYPEPVPKGEILARAGYKSSGDVSKAFAKICRISYATNERGGRLRAAEEFFEVAS